MKPSRQNKPSSSSMRNPKLILPAAIDSRQDPPPNRGSPPSDPGPVVAGSRAMEKGGRHRLRRGCRCGAPPSPASRERSGVGNVVGDERTR
jgi:hypothetical protein